MLAVKYKVLAYITHGHNLLVFEEPDYPDLGIQVPGGKVEDGETPEQAVMREAAEETGLTGLQFGGFLGYQRRDMHDYGRAQIQHRYFYHLICTDKPPARWRTLEEHPSNGTPAPIVFELYWVALPDGVPPLIADHDIMIGRLLEKLRINQE